MTIQQVTGRAVIDDVPYNLTYVEQVSDTYNTTGQCTVRLFTENSVTNMADAEQLQLYINDILSFTGEINNIKSIGPAGIEIVAYDAVVRLKHTTIQETYENATISEVVKDVMEEAGVEYVISVPNTENNNSFVMPETEVLASAGERLRAMLEAMAEQPSPVEIGEDIDNNVHITLTDYRADIVLDDLAERADAIWYVTPENVVVFTTTPTSVIHKLGNVGRRTRGVLDTSAGKTTPPYQSVKVIGDNTYEYVSYSSLKYESFEEAQSIVAVAGTGEPQYTINSENIHTYDEAKNIAESVYSDLQNQQSGGWVKSLGAPEIRTFDVIEMPNHMGGEQYLVWSVQHVLDNDEGFETRVDCGGLISDGTGGNAMYAVDAENEASTDEVQIK